MKSLIIYFSQTGHTRNIAERIHDGIREVTGQSELVCFSDVDINSLAGYDLVGFGCPVFYYQEPLNVRRFLNKLPEMKGRHWFLFCTHGSVLGKIFFTMSKILKKKGICVLGYHHTYADATLPFYPYPTLTTGHPDSKEYEQACAFGREMAGQMQQILRGNHFIMPEPAPVPEEWALEADKFSLEFLKKIMPRLRIDLNKCAHCYECQKQCPSRGIDIDAGPPRIQAPCIYCWRCAMICPEKAIEADWGPLVAIAPKAYARYRLALEKALAQGEFVWRIDPDSLKFDDPYYKQLQRGGSPIDGL